MIWRCGAGHGTRAGFTVLACRPAEAEMRLSYSGLTDLLRDVDPERFEALAPPQRRAVAAALLQIGEAGDGPDQRTVAAALSRCSSDWATRRGAGCRGRHPVAGRPEPASRRVRTAGVAEARSGCSRPSGRSWRPDPRAGRPTLDTTQATSVCVGPLSIGALHHVVRHETGRSLPRPAMVRIAERLEGTPSTRPSLARSLDGDAQGRRGRRSPQTSSCATRLTAPGSAGLRMRCWSPAPSRRRLQRSSAERRR